MFEALTFSSAEVLQINDISYRQLRYWITTGLFNESYCFNQHLFTFHGLIATGLIKELIHDYKLSIHQLCKVIPEFVDSIANNQEPLEPLWFITDIKEKFRLGTCLIERETALNNLARDATFVLYGQLGPVVRSIRQKMRKCYNVKSPKQEVRLKAVEAGMVCVPMTDAKKDSKGLIDKAQESVQMVCCSLGQDNFFGGDNLSNLLSGKRVKIAVTKDPSTGEIEQLLRHQHEDSIQLFRIPEKKIPANVLLVDDRVGRIGKIHSANNDYKEVYPFANEPNLQKDIYETLAIAYDPKNEIRL